MEKRHAHVIVGAGLHAANRAMIRHPRARCEDTRRVRALIEQALPYTLSAETTYELGSDSFYCTIRLPIKAKDEQGVD